MAAANLKPPVLEGFTYDRLLNSGANGHVYLYRETSGVRLVAAKLLPRSGRNDRFWAELRREVLNSRRLRGSPFIVQFEAMRVTEAAVVLLMEYVDGRDLWCIMFQSIPAKSYRGLDEPLARSLFQQLVVGVQFMHRAGFMHRDLKLENVVVVPSPSSWLLKICDMGASINSATSAPQTVVGTEAYWAPELVAALQEAGRQAYDGAQVDVWSCGVLLFVMLFRRHAFWEAQRGLLTAEIAAGRWSPPAGWQAYVSQDAIALLHDIFVVDPNRRITIQGILDRPWFKEGLPASVAAALALPLLTEAELAVVPGLQSEADIIALLDAARFDTTAPPHIQPPSDDEDDFGDMPFE